MRETQLLHSKCCSILFQRIVLLLTVNMHFVKGLTYFKTLICIWLISNHEGVFSGAEGTRLGRTVLIKPPWYAFSPARSLKKRTIVYFGKIWYDRKKTEYIRVRFSWTMFSIYYHCTYVWRT